MEHRADNYECVQKYPILKGYLEHFKQVSINNEIPGLLSFFFIMGQAAVPYVRIPVGGSNLDPRTSIFWIQDTRTGKSAAYQIIEKVLKSAGMESTDYNSGNDAALVGTLVPDPESENRQNPDMIVREGILGGRKGLNFDEGSVILKSGQHNENTTLFLQSALNSAGTGRNILTKHMARDTFSVKSEVSLWITTYPPKGIKEHVLDKGIFQRVLTYWRHWTLEMKREVNHILAESVHNKPEFQVSFDEVIEFFTDLRKVLKRRILELSGIAPLEWDEMDPDDQEAAVMSVMNHTFTVDDSYRPALIAAIDEYYSIVEIMGPEKQNICSSFIMGLQNYTNILAHHMAMIEGTWVVRGDHVDMAKEILFDLYQNLIQWLESEVKIGSGGSEKKKMESAWKQAFSRCEMFDFDDMRGQGWAKKKAVMDEFGKIANLNSHNSINTKYNMYGPQLFKDTREGVRVFIKLRPEHSKGA
tara:strand:- start:12965 stop:14380 length:1416 start_codon:yes stop_codon:yes gene_type:complete